MHVVINRVNKKYVVFLFVKTLIGVGFKFKYILNYKKVVIKKHDFFNMDVLYLNSITNYCIRKIILSGNVLLV